MSLSQLGIGSFYRSGSHDLVGDFYRPCLTEATSYDRAVGYFTSTSLAAAAEGLRPFLDRPSARMRLIASPALTGEDAEAIAAGYELRGIIEGAIVRELVKPVPDPVRQRLELLTWLIANDRLDIRLAVVSNDAGVGIYHEKLGIFSDGFDTVVFTGSANESVSGLLANFESLEVFRSWEPGEVSRVTRRIDDFEELWTNRTTGLQVLGFPEACQEQLLNLYARSNGPASQPPGVDPDSPTGPWNLSIPADIELREYQKEAIDAWWQAGGRGIWEMATGTGKTITALAALSKLWEAAKTETSITAIVTVPYLPLADQWAEEVRRFGAEPILCCDSVAKWGALLDAAFAALRGQQRRITVLIVVNRTFCSSAFQDRLRTAPGTLVFVADEAHTAGAQQMSELLPTGATFRLGLSATPDRYLDPDGTSAIRSFFGPSVYQLGLKEAIELGALVPYDYFPLVVELSEEEHEEYVELTLKIAAAMGAQAGLDPDNLPGGLDLLLFKRARLVGSAQSKVEALREQITPYQYDTHSIVYCADRSGDPPQINQVLDLLGNELGMRVNTFTSEESPSQRREMLGRFSSENLQCLVAIRCLDEGIDIPATKRAFILASTQNPRQFIQRRGRVLRPAPGKSSAQIYDFLVSPPDLSDDPSLFALERRLVGRELTRALELCEAARNSGEALACLRPLRERFDLLSLIPGGP